MRKLILGVVALLSVTTFATGNYKPGAKILKDSYTTISNDVKVRDYNQITLSITNKDMIGLAPLTGNPLSVDKDKIILEGNFYIPKEIGNHDVVIVATSTPDFNDLDQLDGVPAIGKGTSKGFGIYMSGGGKDGDNSNNTPQYVYIYDKVTKKLYNVYHQPNKNNIDKEMGNVAHRAILRQIVSEDFSKRTKKSMMAEDFEFGNGYIEANDLYKMMIGEIKAKDTTKTGNKEQLDRSQHGVSGETVYNYIEAEKKALKKYIDREIKKEVERRIKELKKNNLK